MSLSSFLLMFCCLLSVFNSSKITTTYLEEHWFYKVIYMPPHKLIRESHRFACFVRHLSGPFYFPFCVVLFGALIFAHLYAVSFGGSPFTAFVADFFPVLFLLCVVYPGHSIRHLLRRTKISRRCVLYISLFSKYNITHVKSNWRVNITNVIIIITKKIIN